MDVKPGLLKRLTAHPVLWLFLVTFIATAIANPVKVGLFLWGASKLTGDITQIIAQLPPVLESLTGVKFEKLLEQVPALKKAMGKDVSEDKS